MPWTEVFDTGLFSVAIAEQVDAVTPATSGWVWIDADMPQVSPEAAQTDTRRSRSQRGASTPVLSGREWWRVTLRFPEIGQLAAYNPASDTPDALGPMAPVLDAFGGSAALAYQASGINPTDGNTVSLVTSTGKLGCLVAGVESGGDVQAMGFIKSLSGAGPFAANLFEDLKAQPGSGIARIPTKTYYPGTTACKYWTIRVVGEDASQDYRYATCVVQSATRTYDESDRPFWDVVLVAYLGELRYANGGIRAVLAAKTHDNILGNGRHVVASNIFTTHNDGIADNGTCNVRNLSLAIEWPHRISYCPHADQGVNGVKLGSPTITASFAVPEISDFEDGDDEQFAVSAWRDGTAVALTCYEGDQPGLLSAWAIRNGTVRGLPTPTFIDDVLHRQVEIQAGIYEGDGASTDAGNKPLVYAIG